MAIFSTIFPSLPNYPGPYEVGSIELEIPISEPRKFDLLQTKAETILVRFFYPTNNQSLSKGAVQPAWLPSPGLEYAKGYAKLFRQPLLPLSYAFSLLTCRATIPAIQNAPPLIPSGTGLPVMIFSHGLVGSRNTYSQWCGSMAAHGIFVAAIEHRDGSAPATIVHAGTKKQYTIPYRKIPVYDEETKNYRAMQLAQRTFEVSKLVALLRDINHGKKVNVIAEGNALLDMFKGTLNTERGKFIMAGHSFGAATAVAACKDKETISGDYSLKDEFQAAIMLDIWMMVTTHFEIFSNFSHLVLSLQQN